MDKNFKSKLKTIGYSLICIGLGLAVGFHILPYFFYNKWMDISLETGIEIGRSSIIRDLQKGQCLIRENQIQFYPDTNSTFYFTLRKINEK